MGNVRSDVTEAPRVFQADFAIPWASPKTGIKLRCPKWQSLRMNSLPLDRMLVTSTAIAKAASIDGSPFITEIKTQRRNG